MLYFLFAVPLLAMPGTDHAISLFSSGHKRKGILHLPPFKSSNVVGVRTIPLVASLHTLAENDKLEEKLSNMDGLADKEGFAVVYPNGLLDGNVEGFMPLGVGKSWNGGTCCPKACADKTDDVQFMRDLIKQLSGANGLIANISNHALEVDNTRVYAAGASNGAFMVNRIGCQAPGLFAAIAPLSGPIGNGKIAPWGKSKRWGSDPYDCQTAVVPTLYFHGTADPLVPWNGSTDLGFPSVAAYLDMRKKLNGIESTDTGSVTFKNHTVVCTAYGNRGQRKSAAANNVTFCAHQAGHCWPGSTAQGKCTMDIDATPHIWEFFKQFTKQDT